MVNNNNSDTTKELIEGGKLQVVQGVPQTIANYIQPVMEVNPKLLRRITVIRDLTRTTSGAGTIYTTPADREFYLVGYTLSYIKDAACDSATGSQVYIVVYQDGAIRSIGTLAGITLTAQTANITQSFFQPIKVDKNSTILLSGNTFAAGNLIKSASIFGYVVDNSNA